MSLRARLVAALLSLAAIGLVTLGVVTWTTQRSFLLERVDDQTRSAIPALEHQLDAQDDHRGPGGPGGAANLPPGTYGELRDGGRTTASAVISYGEAALPAPDLPADLPAGSLTTVDAKASDMQYRVRTLALRGGAELVVAVPLAGVDEALDNLLVVEGLVVLLVLLGLGGLASVIVRRELRPLDRIGEVAGQIAAGDLSHRVDTPDARTEVGRLGLAVNAMLGRLETAFAQREASERRLRTFLADASHELRTPLASIRGYAELFRLGAMTHPDEVSRSIRRIEEEAARMGVLVEDLLALARLDEQRAPALEPVDLGSLVANAVADAQATAPERTIDVKVEGELVVEADPDRLHQVVLNLLRNALVHTDAEIGVIVRDARAGSVELEVRDHGGGIPHENPSVVFDRFWRGDRPGRERGRAGAGLGLAIVAGIVESHGGTVTVRNDAGAVFTVRLPAHVGAHAPVALAPR